MKRSFAALRFTEDENLRDRVYWYLCEISVAEGERVLAPVGAHNRLQAARVERLLTAEEENAPFDLRLIKETAAKYGARRLVIGGRDLLEFGGVRYDNKHFTRYGALFLAKEGTFSREELAPFGIAAARESEEGRALYGEIAESTGGVLLCGAEGERAFARLYAFLRGETDLSEVGVGSGVAARLKEKLG